MNRSGSRQGLRHTGRLLLTATALGALVLAGELGTRGHERSAPPPPDTAAPLPAGLRRIRTIQEQSRPNIEGNHRGAYFRTNSAGFRGPEFSEEIPPGTFRIAVLGDSIAMGSGVDYEDSYPAVLGTILRQRYPDWKTEVLNFGLGGINTRQALDRAKKLVPRFRPHLVVHGVTLDDVKNRHYVKNVDGDAWRAYRKRYLRFREADSHLLRFLWPRLLSLRARILPERGSYVAEVRRNFYRNPKAWHGFTDAYAKLVELCRSEGARIVMFTHTRLWYLNAFHPFRPMYDTYAATAASHDVPVIHSLDALLGYYGADLWLSAIDPHPSAATQHILGETLADGLALLPEEYFPRQ